MMRRFGLGVLAYLVPTFALGFVWHLILFTRYYESLAIYRKDVIIPFGFLSMLIQAGIMSYLYPLFYRGGEPLKEGAKFGLIMGLFMGSYGVLAEAGKFDIGPLDAWFLHEGIYFPLQFTLIGHMLGQDRP